MATVKIRNLVLGEGVPKICVPIVERTRDGILRSAREIAGHAPDMVEWRADFWIEEAAGTEQEQKAELTKILESLRGILGETPLLFTIRSKAEGGECFLPPEDYVCFNIEAVDSGNADAIDVELLLGDEAVEVLVEAAHKKGVVVIGSNHDFEQTPEKEEIVRRLRAMQEWGMDVAKIAVMPQSREDVLTLLTATHEMESRYAQTPVITMSMGGAGVLTRLCGEVFGSALTFGTVGKASAPGQIPVEELRQMLELIHGRS